MPRKRKAKTTSATDSEQEDVLALAQLIYDLYIEETNGKTDTSASSL
jgi:hypothetical protein